MHPRERRIEVSLRGHPADLPAGKAEDLACRTDLHDPLRHAFATHQRAMHRAVEAHLLPHLVADGDKVMGNAEPRDHGEIVCARHGSGGIERVIQHDRARPGRHRRLQHRCVVAEMRRLQQDRYGYAPGPPHHRRIGIVSGLEEDHLIALGHQRQHGGGDGLCRTGSDHNLGRRQFQPLRAGIMRADRFAQREKTDARRVLVRLFVQRPRRRIQQRRRGRTIGKTLPEIDCAGLTGKRRHPLEHRRAHVGVDGMDAGSGLHRRLCSDRLRRLGRYRHLAQNARCSRQNRQERSVNPAPLSPASNERSLSRAFHMRYQTHAWIA